MTHHRLGSLSVRIWVALLALLSLMFGVAGVAQATSKEKVAAAGARMRDMGLVKGVDASGDLALNANITRAELVTILVRAFGRDADAQKLKGAPSFPDSVNHPWASGYIAAAKQVIEQRSNGKETVGLPNGDFNPNGNVTAAEAVAFLMKFLGASKDESLSWPDNYIQGAVNAGFLSTEDKAVLLGIKNAPATRGLVFFLADSSFHSYKLAEGGTVYTQFVDKKGPVITLEAEIFETSLDSVTITGTVDAAVAVYVGSTTSPVQLTGGKFTATVPVAVGTVEIAVRAVDGGGNETVKLIKVTRVASHPAAGLSVYIELPEPFSVFMAPHVEVSGAYTAPAGIHSLTVNGHEATASNGRFHAKVDLHEDGLVEVVLTDHAGHTAQDSIMLTPGPHPSTTLVTVDKANAKHGDTVTITFSLKDAFGRPVIAEGHQIAWYTSDGARGQTQDNKDGTYTAQYMPHHAGTVHVYGTLNGLEMQEFATITVSH